MDIYFMRLLLPFFVAWDLNKTDIKQTYPDYVRFMSVLCGYIKERNLQGMVLRVPYVYV